MKPRTRAAGQDYTFPTHLSPPPAFIIRLYFGERRMLSVLFRNDKVHAYIRPLYPKRRIVKLKAALGRRIVEIIALIAENGVIFENHKTMGEAARNKELPAVIRRKLSSDMPAER
jgi:hypothetical protein